MGESNDRRYVAHLGRCVRHHAGGIRAASRGEKGETVDESPTTTAAAAVGVMPPSSYSQWNKYWATFAIVLAGVSVSAAQQFRYWSGQTVAPVFEGGERSA